MTAKIKNYLQCDNCDKRYGYDYYQSVRELRQQARDIGWIRKKCGAVFYDYCRKCKEKVD